MNPSELLRRRTAETHLELERMGFARRLAAGEIDRTEYADYLRATATLVASLRTDVRRHGIDRQRRFLGALESWTRALEADLVHLGIDDGTANLRAQRASLRLVQQLRFHFAEAPGWIVGIAYPVVTDEAFRTIATRAGTLCHTAFGYLVKRYGDRGEAFASRHRHPDGKRQG